MESATFDDVRDDLAKFAESVNSYTAASSRLMNAHNDEFVRVWAEIEDLRDAVLDDVRALSNRIESVANAPLGDVALLADVDSLRAELLDVIAEATATPFDPQPE